MTVPGGLKFWGYTGMMRTAGDSRMRRFLQSPQLAPFRIRDFRLLWAGAFFSFMGTWVQTVAQGWLVYHLTNDAFKLTMVAFCSMLPVSVFGPMAGTLADTFDKRKVLVATQLVYAFSALFLAASVQFNTIRYEYILVVAVINGFATTVEVPTRQSLVSKVVPPENIASAVPMQALTFNFARIVGPAVGMLLLTTFGAQACYLVNGLSYLALIFAVLCIRSDLSTTKSLPQPIFDLIVEGVRYTLRDRRLKMLFLMECTVSMFGLAYIPLLPAFAKDVLLNDKLLGPIYTSVGIGAIIGLASLITFSNRPYKAFVVKAAMTTFGLALMVISFVNIVWVVFPLFSLMGAGAIMQFNTTNTLFQTIAPEALKGRVIAMHFWALSGCAPLALPLFGYLAENWGVAEAMRIGAALVLMGATLGWLNRRRLDGVDNLVKAT